MSMVRGPFGWLRRRPICCSMASVFDRNSFGINSVRKRHRAVKKPGLRRKLHRLGLVERRHRNHFSKLGELLNRRAKVGLAVAHVRAERKIDGFLHDRILGQKKRRNNGALGAP